MAHSNKKAQNDLLSVTAFCSVLFHLVIILGISFKLPDIAARANTDNNLEVVLINNTNKQKVNDSELVSSSDNTGGGNDERAGSTPIPWEAITPSPIQSVKKTARNTTLNTVTPDQLITANSSSLSIQRITPKTQKLSLDQSRAGDDILSANERRLELERLIAKTSQDWENYQKRPRKKFLGPNTKGHGAAKYLDDWKKRVVAVGNANYPLQIKARGLSGTLIVSIEINSDGTIHSLKIIQPSPHKLLNDAAQRIIRDASPFQAFPEEEFFENTNILVITRAIHFLPDNRFDSTSDKARGRG